MLCIPGRRFANGYIKLVSYTPDREHYPTSIIEVIWRFVTHSENGGIPWYIEHSVTTKPRDDSPPVLIIEHKNSFVVRP